MDKPILYINGQSGDRLPGNGEFLLRAAKRLGLDNVKNFTEAESVPDYVLNCEYYEKFYQGKKWTAVWEVDTYLERDQHRVEEWGICDEIFVIAKNALPERLKQFEEKTIFLPLGVDPEMHIHRPENTQQVDFLINGSIFNWGAYTERVRVYNVLKEFFTHKEIGTGNSYGEWWRLLHEARVQFIRPGANHIKDSILAQRFYEQMVIGPVLIYRCDDLKRLNFVEAEDFLTYTNDSEMLHKFKILVDNREFADYIAANGRRKVLRDHTYDHRLLTILSYIPW